MITVDAHCDTVTEAMDKKENLSENKLHVDLKRISKLGRHVQFFAAFADPVEYKGNEFPRVIQILDSFQQQAQQAGDLVKICGNFQEIQSTFDKGLSAAIITIENGGVLKGDLSAVRMFYRLGVRSICLTWNYTNEIADGVSDSTNNMGLTSFGREVVAEMNRLGMLVDVSHLSKKSFWDVLETTKMPIIASHSNAKAICGHPRNLDDEQLMAMKSNKGVVGLNLYPLFLNDSGKASVEDVIQHIEHIVSITGEDSIGLGADFDGVECLPEGIEGIQDIYKIFNRLLSLNYTQDFVEKFAGANFLRIINAVMK